MTEKQRGTADVTLVFWIDGYKGRDSVLDDIEKRFATRARQQGMVVIVVSPSSGPPSSRTHRTSRRVTGCGCATGTHARTRGNHEWNAQRFLEKMRDGEMHFGQFLETELNAWEPV